MAHINPRPRRVAEQIRQELADIVMREMKDPRVAGVSFTAVEVTRDLEHAKVWFTVFGKDHEAALQGLAHAAGFLRSELAQRMSHAHRAQAHLPLRRVGGTGRPPVPPHRPGGGGRPQTPPDPSRTNPRGTMKRKVDGVLLLDKPLGLTSNAALQKAKRLYRAEKAGHTGTLDPFATGLLPLCLGEATKFSQFLLDADKVYLAEVKFGMRTSSGDLDGDVIATRPVDLWKPRCARRWRASRARSSRCRPCIPPSSTRGAPSTNTPARASRSNARRAGWWSMNWTLEAFSGDACTLRVHSGKGFYVRALADDLGEVLGCGAHLVGLRRTGGGPFRYRAGGHAGKPDRTG
jgi:ribosome-binding factor A